MANRLHNLVDFHVWNGRNEILWITKSVFNTFSTGLSTVGVDNAGEANACGETVCIALQNILYCPSKHIVLLFKTDCIALQNRLYCMAKSIVLRLETCHFTLRPTNNGAINFVLSPINCKFAI